jgi:glutamyl-tRNA reductase
VPKVEALIEDAVASYLSWETELGVVPTIKALRLRFEEIRQQELERNLKRVPEEAREQAARLTESLVTRLLHAPTIALRKASKDKGEGKDLAALVRRLFGIDGERGE